MFLRTILIYIELLAPTILERLVHIIMFVEKLLSLIFNPPVGELVDIRLGWRPECVHYSHHLTPQHHLPSSQVVITSLITRFS